MRILPPSCVQTSNGFVTRVEAVLSDAHARKADWGILITNRDTGETLFDWNADHYFTPASNAKLFTSVFALATLGTAYRFHTTLETTLRSAVTGSSREICSSLGGAIPIFRIVNFLSGEKLNMMVPQRKFSPN